MGVLRQQTRKSSELVYGDAAARRTKGVRTHRRHASWNRHADVQIWEPTFEDVASNGILRTRSSARRLRMRVQGQVPEQLLDRDGVARSSYEPMAMERAASMQDLGNPRGTEMGTWSSNSTTHANLQARTHAKTSKNTRPEALKPSPEPPGTPPNRARSHP